MAPTQLTEPPTRRDLERRALQPLQTFGDSSPQRRVQVPQSRPAPAVHITLFLHSNKSPTVQGFDVRGQAGSGKVQP